MDFPQDKCILELAVQVGTDLRAVHDCFQRELSFEATDRPEVGPYLPDSACGELPSYTLHK